MEHPDKKQFQLERLILFSDAVFAIAITLLVIELKVPFIDKHHLTEAAFWDAFSNMWPKFGGFALSFFLIGLYWTIHHKIFGYVQNYNQKLLWLNLLFLFSIVLMPFSTAVYSEYSKPEYVHLLSPYAIYVFNICFICFMNFWLWAYITNPKNKLAESSISAITIRNGKARSVTLASVFLLSLLICLWQPGIGRILLFLIPLAMKLVVKKEKTVLRH